MHATSADERKLNSSFDSIRHVLQQGKYKDRLDKPLAYWALPNDRRLPLAFLNRSIRELIETPFNELMRTRGVGQKKICSLVKLLHRATGAEPPEDPFGIPELADEFATSDKGQQASETKEFNPDLVSESVWTRWCMLLKRRGMEHVPLGRLAPSLQPLPTVIWNTPLSEYMRYSLMEIRELRTHGEKRVRAILEIFHSAYMALRGLQDVEHLTVRLVPRFVSQLEASILSGESHQQVFDKVKLEDEILRPLLDQVQRDCGDMIHELTRQRLGIDSPQRSVREQAQELGVTRARVYQMLEDCGRVMMLRWPEGRQWMLRIRPLLDPSAVGQHRLAMQLFFPGKMDRLQDEDEEPEFDSSQITATSV